MTVAVVTPVPSPYQVELFDAVAAGTDVRPRVVYLERRHAARRWAFREPAHDHVICSEGPATQTAADDWIRGADLVVFSWYASPAARRWMARRAAGGGPWCFWGERPGFRRLPLVGRARRWLRLRPLRKSAAPIWGIGSWAVDAWKREFGAGRPYRNLPYFSDLRRFASAPRPRPAGRRRVLFSGALIRRKGVDLLAEAFARAAAARPALELDVLGAGVLEPAMRSRLAGLGRRVRFLGFRDWQDLPGGYHDADLLVVPSRYDGWGLVVPEGLAAGLPVIATDRTGAARDLVHDGANGKIVPAGCRASLERALVEAADLTDASLVGLSAEARRSVAGHGLAAGADAFAAAAREASGRPAPAPDEAGPAARTTGAPEAAGTR